MLSGRCSKSSVWFPCRVYRVFLCFTELSQSQIQHSTDQLIPDCNFLAKNVTFFDKFPVLFIPMAAGFLFRVIFHKEADLVLL